MSVRSQTLTASLALLLACLVCTPSVAQIVSDEQPPDSIDALEGSTDTYSVDNLGDYSFDGATPDNYFLTRHQGRIVGLKFMSNSLGSAVDHGPDSGMSGQPYWDEYGLGTYYVARGGSRNLPQVWHTNFTNGEHRQVTDGKCIPGVDYLTRSMDCVYSWPIASSVNRIAFIQEVSDVDVSADMQRNKQIVVGSNDTLRSVRF